MATQFRHAAFAAEFEPAEGLGRRRTARAPVSLDARLGRGGLDRALCRVTDLSINGARLQTYSELRSGTMIWLTLPGVGQCTACVVWAHDFEAGVEFQMPLTPKDFDTLTAQ
ncbi:PilZ domain-containing protein [Sphingomonas psychrotolerans]|uniref:PilZ domain-containing protein n=1 Tax=Sphingomonas psychrotolerans TaxID=1327635 RepID=A0ABU3N0I6_9SPHN|nr:PilZ domain-containing protein [Sphingomonas psychrotolerans]MDT8758068.1 PilZ domain-containing protein [Sphingomonas psychrotolerans]